MGAQQVEKLAYSIAELEQATSLGKSKLYQMMADGELGFRTIGRRRIIPASEARRLFDQAA